MKFSDEEIRRYGRQLALAEVGGAGQERLRAARVRAHDEVEALYLAGAGVGTLVVPSEAIAEAARALNPLVAAVVAPEEFEPAFKKSNGGSTFSNAGSENLNGGSNFPIAVEESALRAVATLKELLEL